MPDPQEVEHGVFSACAEVVPCTKPAVILFMCILRVRGGSSDSKLEYVLTYSYSPRARR